MDENREDTQLLNSIAIGSRHSFNVFYERHVRFVLQIAMYMIKNKAEAEDICHDVFIEVFKKADQYQASKGSVKAWLAIKTKSRAIDQLRKKKPVLRDKLEEHEHGADVQFLLASERKLVRDALNHIPREQGEAIYRSYFHNETHKEIASAMNKPLGSVKSLIRYGLNNLRKKIRIISSGGEKNDIQ